MDSARIDSHPVRTISYASGPDAPIRRETLGAALAETAGLYGDDFAVWSMHQKMRLTWAELAHEAARVAAGLRALGLKAGDRVGLWATNCAEWVVIQFGCAVAGMVLVNVNPAYRTHELSFVLRKSRMKALFLHSSDHRCDYRHVLEESRAGLDAALEHVVYLDSPDWPSFLREPDGASTSIDPDEAANIQYTSGTTGQPKGVMLTHVNLFNNGRFFAQGIEATAQDRICVPVPLFHCFGSVIGNMTALASGACVVLPASYFDAVATMEAVHVTRATMLYGVPAMFIAQLQHPGRPGFDLTSLRTGVMAGAPCPIEIVRNVISELPCPQMMVAYGQTESTPVVTMSRTTDPIELRATTIGFPLPNTEVRIASQTTGETLRVGEQGELLARGYMVMKGYDGEPEATSRAVDSEGWLHTGDLAVMRPDGYLNITGRAKDMIIRGGENIYPREIEEFLHTHPKISDVQVVGVPDERLGEEVLAWIRLKPEASASEEEIREFCRGKLAHFKIPHYIRVVDAFPMTLSGKVQKYKIREIEIRERGLEKAAGLNTA